MLPRHACPYGERVLPSPTLSPRSAGGSSSRTFGLIHDDIHPVLTDALRIVVVEDDCWIRAVLHDVLADAGFTVIDAADGRTGLRLIDEHMPDLVLLDVAMPDLSGIEVLRRLRRGARTRDLPIVVLSAYPAILSAQDAGAATCVMSKPMDMDVLLEAVRQVLGIAPASIPSADLVPA
jgi:DNA-binding response OmpR family regulator